MSRTRKGKELIENWHAAKRRVADLKDKLHRAILEAEETEQSLGELLVLEDAGPQEKFCMWYEDTLVQAWRETGSKLDHDYTIIIRTQGKALR